MFCADDVGKAINPLQVEGQVHGAIVQAAGYALMENFIQRDGHPLTNNFSTYLIPTVLDIPDVIEPIILEHPDPQGPFGARRDGGNAINAFGPGDNGFNFRCHRYMVFGISAHTRAGFARIA